VNELHRKESVLRS